jgi:hypothetical protein
MAMRLQIHGTLSHPFSQIMSLHQLWHTGTSPEANGFQVFLRPKGGAFFLWPDVNPLAPAGLRQKKRTSSRSSLSANGRVGVPLSMPRELTCLFCPGLHCGLWHLEKRRLWPRPNIASMKLWRGNDAFPFFEFFCQSFVSTKKKPGSQGRDRASLRQKQISGIQRAYAR